MNFSVKGTMRGTPGIAMTNRISPLQCSGQVSGKLTCEVGAIEVHVAKIPVMLRIPFLRRSTPILIGSIGPTDVKVDPFTCSLREFAFSCEGLLGGKNGFGLTTEGKVALATEVSLAGTTSGDIGLASIHFGKAQSGKGAGKASPRKRAAE